jgi:hypothetical protein
MRHLGLGDDLVIPSSPKGREPWNELVRVFTLMSFYTIKDSQFFIQTVEVLACPSQRRPVSPASMAPTVFGSMVWRRMTALAGLLPRPVM